MQDCTLDNINIKYDSRCINYNPTMNKRILEFLRDKNDVDAFIFQVNNYEKCDFYYLENTNNNIEKLFKENEKYFKCQIDNKIINNFTFIHRY